MKRNRIVKIIFAILFLIIILLIFDIKLFEKKDTSQKKIQELETKVYSSNKNRQ